ncbi:MAG: hypothetical protein BWZ05_01248 [Bacteroidetes bacterium ADurb.BinA245]|jgi:hypothetical protein|nr:MAG: hypothetical protein BWZ05_01248 [Bacteroidetes bacterium ADurb.BinA245]
MPRIASMQLRGKIIISGLLFADKFSEIMDGTH